jgi:RNA polymerase sigma-70 factor (ECF subfamily)
VTRNAIIDGLRKIKPDIAGGDRGLVQQLSRRHASDETTHREIQQEQKQQLSYRMAENIRSEFGETKWLTFRHSSIELANVADVADQLKCSAGSIYAARSQVMRRIRQGVSELEADLG